MSFRTGLLKRVEAIRNIRHKLDVDPLHVTVRTRVWSGGIRGVGTAADSDLALSPGYLAREVNTTEIYESGGAFQQGDLKVGPITPAQGSSGFSISQLTPTITANGTEIIYLVSGAYTGEYTLVQSKNDHSFSYYLWIRRKRTTP